MRVTVFCIKNDEKKTEHFYSIDLIQFFQTYPKPWRILPVSFLDAVRAINDIPSVQTNDDVYLAYMVLSRIPTSLV